MKNYIKVEATSNNSDFPCGQCDYKSATVAEFNWHIKESPEHEPKCVACGTTYASMKFLKDHVRKYHFNAGQVICKDCGKISTNPEQHHNHWLNQHKQEDDDLFCNICFVKCKSMLKLKRHIKLCLTNKLIIVEMLRKENELLYGDKIVKNWTKKEFSAFVEKQNNVTKMKKRKEDEIERKLEELKTKIELTEIKQETGKVLSNKKANSTAQKCKTNIAKEGTKIKVEDKTENNNTKKIETAKINPIKLVDAIKEHKDTDVDAIVENRSGIPTDANSFKTDLHVQKDTPEITLDKAIEKSNSNDLHDEKTKNNYNNNLSLAVDVLSSFLEQDPIKKTKFQSEDILSSISLLKSLKDCKEKDNENDKKEPNLNLHISHNSETFLHNETKEDSFLLQPTVLDDPEKIKYDINHLPNNSEDHFDEIMRDLNSLKGETAPIEVIETKTNINKDVGVESLSDQIKVEKNYSVEETKNEEKKLDDILTVKSEDGENCNICGKNTKNPKAHIKRIHTNQPISCEVCGKLVNNLKLHKQFVHEEQSSECDVCGKVFKNFFNFRSHRKIHNILMKKNLSPEKHFCHMCGISTTSKKGLSIHLKNVHQSEPVSCDKCGIKLKNMSSLKRHLKLHDDERKGTCIPCGKETRNLYRHNQNVHNKNRNKPAPCEVCGSTFKTIYILASHKKLHEDKKDTCITCGKVTNDLKRHNMNVHKTPTKPVMQMCTICGRDVKNIIEHIKYTHEDNPVSCDICGTAMKNSSKLQKHKTKVHVPDEKITCSECGFIYDNKYKLYAHKYAVHRSQESECDTCGKTFKTLRLLKSHIKWSHKDILQ